MRSRSHPHRGTATTRARSRGDARIVTLPPPDPWTDRDFAFHARESLRRRAYVPSAEAKREREADEDAGHSPSARGWSAVSRSARPVATISLDAPEPRQPDRGHADTSLRDQIAHRIVAQAGDAGLDVTIRVLDGIVTLEGPVPERVTKDVVQAIVEACPGVRGVDNRLRVDWIDETPSVARASGAPAPPDDDYLVSPRGAPTSTMKRTE